MPAAPDAFDPEKLIHDVEAARRRLREDIVDMDPGDVILIL